MLDDIDLFFDEFDHARECVMRLSATETVTPADVAVLERQILGEGALTRADVEALFAIEGQLRERCPEWSEFFIRSVTDHVVWSSRPTGIIDDIKGEWLIDAADAARTPTAFAVLVSVLETAHRTPAWFPAAVRSRAVSGWPGIDRMTVTALADMAQAA